MVRFKCTNADCNGSAGALTPMMWYGTFNSTEFIPRGDLTYNTGGRTIYSSSYYNYSVSLSSAEIFYMGVPPIERTWNLTSTCYYRMDEYLALDVVAGQGISVGSYGANLVHFVVEAKAVLGVVWLWIALFWILI